MSGKARSRRRVPRWSCSAEVSFSRRAAARIVSSARSTSAFSRPSSLARASCSFCSSRIVSAVMAPVPSTVVSLSLVTRSLARSSSISRRYLFRPMAAAVEAATSTTNKTNSTTSTISMMLNGIGLEPRAKSGWTTLIISTLPSPHSSENCGQMYPPRLNFMLE